MAPIDDFPQLDDTPQPGNFPATRWSLVLAARGQDTILARRALGELCQSYWYPLYAFVRRQGLTPEDAEDCTQEFFHSLIERDSLQTVAPEAGRLRSFLLSSVRHHIVDAARRRTAQKRGGGAVVSIDQQRAEELMEAEPDAGAGAELMFDRSWAHALMEAVMGDLEKWYAHAERSDLFASLRGFLEWNRPAPSYSEVAARLGTTEGALRSAVHTMRQRFRQLIAQRIAETVSTAAEAREETEYLCRVLAGA